MKSSSFEKSTKAVLLAGGKGKRLLPLTATKPKPLLKVGGAPVIEGILELLSKNGIRDAAITLGYKGDMIKEALGEEHSGVRLTYFTEDEPLGSAGGVKKTANFINGDDFIVICADSVCDFDLTSALKFFREKDVDGLILVTSKILSPLEFGLVCQDASGKVTSFIEKPSWSGVCSGKINTGMYIFKKSVLELIPEGRSDFGFDMFTKMLCLGKTLFAYDIGNNWCDVGTMEDYYTCNMKRSFGQNVILQGCSIDKSTSIQRSVLGERVMVGAECRIDGAVIGDEAVIGEKVKIYQGAVIGPCAVIGDRCVIESGVLVQAGMVVKSGEHLQNPLYGKELFSKGGIYIEGARETELYSLGVILRRSNGGSIGVMYDEEHRSSRAARIIMLGLTSDEGNTFDAGKGFPALASFTARARKYDLTLMVRPFYTGVFISFYDCEGLYPGAAFESTLRHASALVSGQTDTVGAHPLKIEHGIKEDYIDYLLEIGGGVKKGTGVTVYLSGLFGRILSECLALLGCRMMESGGDVIIAGDGGGESVDMIYDGVFFDFDHIRCVCILAYRELGYKEITLPHRACQSLKDFVEKAGMRLGLCAETIYDNKERSQRHNIPQTPALYDGGCAVMMFLSYASSHQLSGRALMEMLPVFSTKYKSIILSRGGKETVARSGENYDKEGFVIVRARGRIRIIPENGENLCLCAEAGNIEDAAELIKDAENYIKSCTDANK